MKKIYELTPFECYEKIFKPIFGYDIMDKYIEYGWNIKDMVNGKWKPRLYIPEEMSKIKDELFNCLSKEEKLKSFRFNSLKDNIKILYKNGLADEYGIPIIKINYGKDKEYIEVCVGHEKHYSNRRQVKMYEINYNRRWIRFYANGNIMKSYLNRVDNGGMVTHEYVESCYLSYTQTLEVRDKLLKLDVDCVNIVEVEYSI